ncbi:hypothetical protein UFOVP299_2 [uncultured Caudovirales phage]|uniref:Uncharacterized protein n=1 Tax=uncultured Caudovirales phage TaxID=2100421 RepID=A0A6J5LS68_9CAUD|nr:hypothetical protein UFOVP299_2 [uncultured Caudovirales phage]
MAKYNSIEKIPAKLFFEVLSSKDYTLLEADNEDEDLEMVFIAIYDDFFVKSDNPEAKRYLNLTTNIAFLEYKLATIKQVMEFTYFAQLTKEMRDKLLKALEVGCGIYIDKDADFTEEVKRVMQVETGIIENDLTMEKLDLDSMVKNSSQKAFDFYDNIVSLSNVHERNIDETLTLAMYIALDKSAKQKIKKQNNGK